MWNKDTWFSSSLKEDLVMNNFISYCVSDDKRLLEVKGGG